MLEQLLASEMEAVSGGAGNTPVCHCTSGAAAVVLEPVIEDEPDNGPMQA